MTGPFAPQVGYSATKPMIKYQTLSLQVSNAVGVDRAPTRKWGRGDNALG